MLLLPLMLLLRLIRDKLDGALDIGGCCTGRLFGDVAGGERKGNRTEHYEENYLEREDGDEKP